MAKNLNNEVDVQESLDSLTDSSNFMKIEDGITPVFFLSSSYYDGYIHWVDIGGQRVRVACGGGLAGKGFAPDSCKICAYTLDKYKASRTLEAEGNVAGAKEIKDAANDMRAKYEAHFIAAKGEFIRVKDGDKKVNVADYDDAEIGVLSLTQRQYEDFIGLISDERVEYVKTSADLLNRSIKFDKRKRDKARYSTIEFVPSRKQIDCPVEFKESDFDLESDFAIDQNEIEKIYATLTSGVVSQVDYKETDVSESDSDVVDDEFLNGDDEFSSDENESAEVVSEKKEQPVEKGTGVSKKGAVPAKGKKVEVAGNVEQDVVVEDDAF